MDSKRGSERGSGLGGTLSLTHTAYTVKRGGAVGVWGYGASELFLSVEGSSAAKVNPIPPVSDTNGIAVDWGIPDPNHFGNPIGGG
jgi:hypothetical protein